MSIKKISVDLNNQPLILLCFLHLSYLCITTFLVQTWNLHINTVVLTENFLIEFYDTPLSLSLSIYIRAESVWAHSLGVELKSKCKTMQ